MNEKDKIKFTSICISKALKIKLIKEKEKGQSFEKLLEMKLFPPKKKK